MSVDQHAEIAHVGVCRDTLVKEQRDLINSNFYNPRMWRGDKFGRVCVCVSVTLSISLTVLFVL